MNTGLCMLSPKKEKKQQRLLKIKKYDFMARSVTLLRLDQRPTVTTAGLTG